MRDYHIGSLDKDGKAALFGEDDESDEKSAPTDKFLQFRKWKKAVLYSKTNVSWDTRLFTFKLDHDKQTLGLPVGKHLMIRLKDPATRETIIRSYTPISETSKAGFMDILIKVYFDNKSRKGGKMSQALDSIPIGHFVDFKGPIGQFQYFGNGLCTVNEVERRVQKFVMISGGSGITPMYQVLRAVMHDEADDTLSARYWTATDCLKTFSAKKTSTNSASIGLRNVSCCTLSLRHRMNGRGFVVG